MSSPASSPTSDDLPTSLKISEVYPAEQGEGQYAGTSSLFIRTSGCNLRCWFCDTPHTSWAPEGQLYSLEQILYWVDAAPIEHIVLTGGEPFIQAGIVPLAEALKARGKFITIETAGTVFRPVVADLISLSPKLSNSTPAEEPWRMRHDQLRENLRALEQFRRAYVCQWKFVIDTPEDIHEVQQYVARFTLPKDEVWLMPQARTTEELQQKTPWIQEETDARGWQFSPRLHIEKYGNVRGK